MNQLAVMITMPPPRGSEQKEKDIPVLQTYRRYAAQQ